jgi:hypothetical protein
LHFSAGFWCQQQVREENKIIMKSFVKKLALCAVLGATMSTNAVTFTLDPAASWLGFMNVFNLPTAGGAFQFGSGWGTADLCAKFTGTTLTLAPNTIGDPNSYWYTPGGGPGSKGNKIMDASMYIELSLGSYTGQTLTFTGLVLDNSLFGKTDANGLSWTATAFIKDFAPDYSSFNQVTAPLVNGVFSVNLATINDPTRHLQYGFEVVGPDVWVTAVAPFGQIDIAAIPEPGILALAGLGAAIWAVRRRQS